MTAKMKQDWLLDDELGMLRDLASYEAHSDYDGGYCYCCHCNAVADTIEQLAHHSACPIGIAREFARRLTLCRYGA